MAELLDRVSARELAEWAAYYNLEPWGEPRADLRAGIVAATVANTQRQKGRKPFTPREFMPEFDRRSAQTMAEQQQLAAALAAAGWGTFKRGAA